jgi:acetyl esterase/lipase
MRRTVFASLLLLAVSSCDTCRPGQGNFALIGFWNFPSGQTFTLVTPSPSGQTVNFIARVYYPSYDPAAFADPDNPNFEGIAVADGQHPLVVFGHGQYSLGAPTNYLGMTNLMHHLASWGYIAVSVNLDVVQGGWSSHQHGIPQRGELLLSAVDRMLQLNGDPSSLFNGKIDASRIALIGHSRGGGGAISAVNRNLAQGSPRAIKALATISPVDFSTQPVQAGVPHLSLYGSWDGDLDDGEGPRIWDGGVRTAQKQLVEIYGANHFHFTDNVVYSGESVEITREDHHELAQGFINAWFDVHVCGSNRYDWPLYLVGLKDMRPGVNKYLQILSNDFRAVDDGSPLGTEATNNLGGANTFGSLALFDDRMLTSASDHFYNQGEGLVVHWDAAIDELVLAFNPQNVTGYTYLHFRAAQRPRNASNPAAPENALNDVNTLKDFRVELRDAANNTAVVAIEAYLGGLQYPDSSGSLTGTSTFQYKAIMRSFRIPLADFAGLDLNTIKEIRFRFDRPNETGFRNITGGIAIDDVEFSK